MTLTVRCGNCPHTKRVLIKKPYYGYTHVWEPCDEHPCPMGEVDPAELAKMKIRFAEEP